MLYLINHVIWFDDNSIRRNVYFCLIEENFLYIVRATLLSTNTNLKKLLGNATKRRVETIIRNLIRRRFDDGGLICRKIDWDDLLLKTKSIKEVLVDHIYSNFFFFNYYITRNSWSVRRLN